MKSSSHSHEELLLKCKERKALQFDQGHRLLEERESWTKEFASHWCYVLVMDWEVDVTRILKEATLHGSKTDRNYTL